MRFKRLTERAFALFVAEKIYNSLIAIVKALQLKVSEKSNYLRYLTDRLLVKGRRCCLRTSAQSHFVSTDLHAWLFPEQRNTTASLNVTHNVLVEINYLKKRDSTNSQYFSYHFRLHKVRHMTVVVNAAHIEPCAHTLT